MNCFSKTLGPCLKQADWKLGGSQTGSKNLEKDSDAELEEEKPRG